MSLYTVAFFAVFTIALLSGFIYMVVKYTGNNDLLSSRTDELEISETNLNLIRNDLRDLVDVMELFDTELTSTKDSLGINDAVSDLSMGEGGDLSSIFNVTDQKSITELNDITQIKSMLENSADSMTDIREGIVFIQDLLTDLPTLWPLKGVKGYFTNPFGVAIDPFNGNWYIHRGIDLALTTGIPIVATANGIVEKKEKTESGFGNYIVIRHKYGFYTLYAHMHSIAVNEGDTVTQGQVVGTMGETGLGTGPHLHYEVKMGSQLIDPLKFLLIDHNNNFVDSIIIKSLQDLK